MRSRTSAARRNISPAARGSARSTARSAASTRPSSKRAIAHYPAEVLHSGRPVAVSITQSTEIGTVYGLDEIAAISAICRKAGLPLHMDGARFANALVSLDATPAEMTWKRGVDTLSFGGTKNGCWCAEAIVLFDRAKAAEMAFIHKRAAQLYSKSRFIAAQFARLFRGRAVAGDGAPCQFAGRQAGRPYPRVEEAPARLGAAANEVFAVMTAAEKEPPAEEGRGVLRLAHAAFLSRRARRRRSHLPLRHQLRHDRRRRRRVRRSDRLTSPAYSLKQKRRPKAPLWTVLPSAG